MGAAKLGSHVLVGIHTDSVLMHELGAHSVEEHIKENFDARVDRLLHDRYVSSVLKDAPWSLSEELVESIGIKVIVLVAGCGDDHLSKIDHKEVYEDMGLTTHIVDVSSHNS